MPHDVIEGVPQGEEEARLNMKLLRVATLLNEIDVFQSDRAQVHINTPFACHSLQREVPQVILKRQAVLLTELDQRVRCLTIALFVGDGNREDNILLMIQCPLLYPIVSKCVYSGISNMATYR